MKAANPYRLRSDGTAEAELAEADVMAGRIVLRFGPAGERAKDSSGQVARLAPESCGCAATSHRA
jgi:hypothetical protein